MHHPAFFEATFVAKHHAPNKRDVWIDESTQDFFIFTSPFGSITLRKRQAYPATFARSMGSALVFGYGDESLGRTVAEQPLVDVPEKSFVQEEFLYGYADCQQQSVVMQRDALCTMPLFTRSQNNTIVVSNRYDRLFNGADKQQVRINEAALVNYLLFDDRHHQIAADADVLYDRVRFIFQGGTSRVLYPGHASIVNRASQEKGSPHHFKQALETTLDTYWQRYGAIGFQLSGGLDSATAPGYFASQGRQVVSASFGLPAVMGERQRGKLNDMRQRFPLLRNHVIDLTPGDFFPFSDRVMLERWDIAHEYQDMHQLAAIRMADYFASQGITALFTGVGGDELCQNITNDQIFPFGSNAPEARSDTELPVYMTDTFKSRYTQSQASRIHDRPAPAIAYSVILTNIGFNNTFIDRNVWPVAPLSDPGLFLYAQSIPAWHRHNKGLLRMYQFARQFPPSIVHPETVEDFSEFIHLCKPHISSLLDAFFDNSMLAQRGLIDEPLFKSHYQEIAHSSYDPTDTRPLELIRLLTAEINLQAYR